MGGELLRSQWAWDGSSCGRVGTGRMQDGTGAISVLWEQVGQDFAVGWARGGTGRTYFIVTWEVPSHPGFNGIPIPLRPLGYIKHVPYMGSS